MHFFYSFYLSLSVAGFPSLKWNVLIEVANVSLAFCIVKHFHIQVSRKTNGNVNLAYNTNILQTTVLGHKFIHT